MGAQVFTKKVSGKIARLYDMTQSTAITGSVTCSGVGTDTFTVTVYAGGYPGEASSIVSCMAEY
jgi:hypothetical protein